jgi:hypothetical protein
MSPSKEGVDEFLARSDAPKGSYENNELYNIISKRKDLLVDVYVSFMRLYSCGA